MYENNEMAAILVYGTGISSFLFKYFVLFHHPTGATDHVSENDLLFNVESLETLGKLDSIEGTTYYVLRKLEIIKAELVTHVKTDWRDWTFKDLLESLKKWTETNLVTKVSKRGKFGKDPYSQSPGGRAFGSRDHEIKCVYCESTATTKKRYSDTTIQRYSDTGTGTWNRNLEPCIIYAN